MRRLRRHASTDRFTLYRRAAFKFKFSFSKEFRMKTELKGNKLLKRSRMFEYFELYNYFDALIKLLYIYLLLCFRNNCHIFVLIINH